MISSLILYLTSLSSVHATIVIVVIPSILIGAMTIIVRRIFGYKALSQNNTLAGIKFGIVGLTYVMILTFATISVWEKFSIAQSAVIDEAAAARAIYTIAKGEKKEQLDVRNAIKNYLDVAINKAWPLMAQEKRSAETRSALEELYRSAVSYDESGAQTTQIASELFKHIDRINDSRQIRITLSKGIVPDLLWAILFAGSFVTLGFTLFFGGEHIIVQSIMTSLTSATMLMALLVIISFDHPFSGEVSISSEPLQSALNDMD